MNLFLYGIGIMAVGVWQMWRKAVERRDGHTHRCRACRHTWHHMREDWPTVAALAAAHTCPKCGVEQFEIDKVGNIDSADAHAYGRALKAATTPASKNVPGTNGPGTGAGQPAPAVLPTEKKPA